MCIIIVKPKNTTISDEYLRNSFENNDDGAGIAYTKDEQLYIIKGIFNVDDFVKKVREVEKIAEGSILIHCRIGTSGLKDANNCHPFIVNNSTVMVHNGILDIEVPKDSLISDTQIFVNEYLKNAKEDFTKDEGYLKLLSYAIGNNNKFAFLDNKGNHIIVNEKQGEWNNGIWYSNQTYTYSYNWGCAYGNWYNTVKIPKKEKEKIKRIINNLNEMDVEHFGNYPIWNRKTQKLERECYNKLTKDKYYLDEIDYNLQNEYEEIREIYSELKYGGL